MGIEKYCLYHKVEIKTSEDEMRHMGTECIIQTQGSGLGEISPILDVPGFFTEEISYEAGVILPYETEAEKIARKRQLGIPDKPTASK